MRQTRRSFIKSAGLGSAGIIAGIPTMAANLEFTTNNPNAELNISIFSKHLQFLNYHDACDSAKEIGFDGLDLTVRPKGHVLPENVESDLPKAVEAMNAYGMKPLMFSSSVKDVSSEEDRRVLSIGAQLGFKYYRPAWYKYNGDEDITTTVSKCTEQLIDLSHLSKETGIIGSYHNHSGHYFGAPVWDLNTALDKVDPLGMGCQYDIMHNVIEGGKSWEIDFRLIHDKINTIVIKDIKWSFKNGKWDKEYVPMGEGMVDFKHYFKLLKKYKINVPISMHFEYNLGGAEKGLSPTIDKKDVFSLMKKDLLYTRALWDSV